MNRRHVSVLVATTILSAIGLAVSGVVADDKKEAPVVAPR